MNLIENIPFSPSNLTTVEVEYIIIATFI